MNIGISKYDQAAIIGCYLNGCSVDDIYSVFEGVYYKTEILVVIDDFRKRTGWNGKDFHQRKQTSLVYF